MWFLNFIPAGWLQIVVHATVALGIALWLISKLARHIPTMGEYSIALKVVGTVLFIVGIYFEGGYTTDMSWRAKESALKEQIAILEQKSDNANTKIQYKVVTQIKTIHDTKIVVHEKIKEVSTKIDADCKVDPEAIQILNQASQNPNAQVVVTGIKANK